MLKILFFFITLPALFFRGDRSEVTFKITDMQGDPSKATIVFFQEKKEIFRFNVNREMEKSIVKGKYNVWVINCDTLDAPLKIWNQRHEYQFSVKAGCLK